jgi:hypothetical protein
MARALVGNASSPRQVKAAGESTKRERDRWKDQLTAVSNLAEGRAVLYRFLDRCGMWETSFAESTTRMAFHEGQRNVGLWLLAELGGVNPDALSQMTKEALQMMNQRAEPKERTDEPLEDEENAD